MNNFVKVIKAFINALMTIILILGIIFVLFYLVGIEPYIVVSGSMEPSIPKGSLSFVNKHFKYDDIKINDVIAFRASTGDKVTHRVINITNEGIETQGDQNNNSDGISTTKQNFIGKNILSIPKAGYVVSAIQTPKGKVVLITFIIVVFLSGFLMDEKKNKTEKTSIKKAL